MAKKNIYKHSIDLNKIRIKNSGRESFVKELEKIKYRGYEVEDISDGRKIVIAKPGGKQSFGKIRKEDFFVFIYNPNEQALWQITHKQIYEDLVEKAKNEREQNIPFIKNCRHRITHSSFQHQ